MSPRRGMRTGINGPVSFTGSYTKDGPNFLRQNNFISQKVWRKQGGELQELFKT